MNCRCIQGYHRGMVWETPRHFHSSGSHLQRSWVSFLFSLESVLPKKAISPSVVRYCFYNSGVGWGHWDSCNFLSPCSLANFVSILGLFFFFLIHPGRNVSTWRK